MPLAIVLDIAGSKQCQYQYDGVPGTATLEKALDRRRTSSSVRKRDSPASYRALGGGGGGVPAGGGGGRRGLGGGGGAASPPGAEAARSAIAISPAVAAAEKTAFWENCRRSSRRPSDTCRPPRPSSSGRRL